LYKVSIVQVLSTTNLEIDLVVLLVAA